MRLAELLPRAAIDSPLRDIAVVTSFEQLENMPKKNLLNERFERFRARKARWPQTENGGVERTGDGSAYVLRSYRHDEKRGWVFPAEPNSQYVFERLVQATGQLDADFAVVEAESVALLRQELQSGDRWQDALMLRLHWPEPPRPDGSWQRGTASFTTTPETKALGVFLRPTPSRAEELAQFGRRTDREARYDDVRLAMLRPTAEQMIGLLKGRALAEGADPQLGMEKHGQFPPALAAGGSDDNFSFRYGLYAPPVTRITFPLQLTRDTALRFSHCLSRETYPRSSATFEVSVRAGDAERVLWSRTLVAEEPWRWQAARVDLGAFTGQEIELTLATSEAVGIAHPVWGNPELEVAEPEGPRNVVLIAVDTLRADRLSCYGYPRQTSPRLDELAADSVRFEHAISNATWTCPSFASIFTGLAPSRHGVWNHGHVSPLGSQFDTLAEQFRARGWRTQSIAYKIPLYAGGYDQGFDVSRNVPRVGARAQDNLNEALAWLERNAHRRNFLFLHFDDPHQPFTQPEPFDRTFGGDPAQHGIRLPFSFHGAEPENEQGRQIVRDLYDGEVAYVDDRIGAFLDQLRARGLYDDAVIVFVSDHGEELWEHGEFGHSNGKLFDEAIRVPLLVKSGGGEFARGAVVETQVRAFDVMPTLLELAGLPVPANLDAASLVPLLGEEGADTADRIAVAETSKNGFAVRNRRWKYIAEYWKRDATKESLYDHRADPAETDDVAAQFPDVLARMRLQMLDYVMLHRPGTYLVAVTDNSTPDFELNVHGADSAVTFFGARLRAEDGSLVATGRSVDALGTVASLNPTGSLEVEGMATPAMRRYVAGDLERIVQSGAAGVHLFEGPPPAAVSGAADSQTMDLERIEGLKALGYVETGK